MADVFGPPTETRNFSLAGYFDPQLRDGHNFQLDDNVLSLLCALCLTASMIFVFDLVYRAVVRANPHRITIQAMYRSYLLSLSTNLLHWFPDVFERNRSIQLDSSTARVCVVTAAESDDDGEGGEEGAYPGGGGGVGGMGALSGRSAVAPTLDNRPAMRDDDFAPAGEDVGKEQPAGRVCCVPGGGRTESASEQAVRVRRWARVLQISVLLAGVMLTVVELALIFLATNRIVAVEVDKTRLPSLRLHPAAASGAAAVALVANIDRFCPTVPLTERTGFIANASLSRCHDIDTQPQDIDLAPGQLEVKVVALQATLLITVDSAAVRETVTLHSFVNTYNDKSYEVHARAVEQADDAFAALNRAFARRGANNLTDPKLGKDVNSWTTPNWEATFDLGIDDAPPVPGNVRDMLLSRPTFVQVYLNESSPFALDVRAAAWTRLLLAEAASQFDFRGAARGFAFEEDKIVDLETYAPALVLRDRPWLSLFACVLLTGALLALWIVVAFGLRWGAGTDYDMRWTETLMRMTRAGRFAKA